MRLIFHISQVSNGIGLELDQVMAELFGWLVENALWVGTGAFISGVALFYLVMMRMLKHRNHPSFSDRIE